MIGQATAQTEAEAELAALKASFVRTSWYAVVLDSSGLRPGPRLVADHLHWLKAKEASGELVLTGLRFGESGGPVDGLTILRATDLDQARRIAEGDPLVTAGATFTLHRWDVAAGSLPISLRLSDRSIGIE